MIHSNQYMLKHLTKPRQAKIKNFTYSKTLIDSVQKHNKKSKVIAWNVYYNGIYITTLDTLKEVRHFVSKDSENE